MKIFLDIGTHNGQTLEEVTKSKYEFDKIYAFEPMPNQFKIASEIFACVQNLEIFNFGLYDRTGEINIYGDNGNLGASIYPNKNDIDKSVVTRCHVEEASTFFKRYIPGDSIVIVKLNCEGSEIPILNNLIDSGEVWKIFNVMIDFDIRKVVGMEHEENKLIEKMKSIGFSNYSLCDDVMVGRTHQDRIANWLSIIERRNTCG